jgi:ATP-binding cassette subfamily C protein CydD
MKPLDPRLLSKARATAGYLILVVALATFAVAATVAIAWSLSNFVVNIFTKGQTLDANLSLLVSAGVAAVARAVVHFAQEWAGFWVAGRVKLDLRHQALDTIANQGSGFVSRHGTAELTQLLGPSLDSLDIYFSKYLPQLVFTALVTPSLTALIWFLDAPSGITVLLTLPLIPLFMAMIGYVTKDLQDSQLAALERLNGHFLEIIKGLVTLKIFNRTQRQEQILFEVSEQYRDRTMRVLRLSFLSGFALELAASLSVALIAVSIGLRLVEGQLALFVGLFILIVAPEVYLPLRNVGAQFHAAAQGVSVSTRILDLIGEPVATQLSALEFEPKGLTVLVGRSGSGKSLALKQLASKRGVWMPQQDSLLPGTLRYNIVGEEPLDLQQLGWATNLAQIADLDLETAVSEDDGLSGGQRQRVAYARALYRLRSIGERLLLLDEPTSQLDSLTQQKVIAGMLQLISEGVEIVAVTHSRALIDAADQVVKID